MAGKKWSTKAFDTAQEGSLTKLGWPDGGKLVEAARKDRGAVMKKLGLLANASGNPATKAKAKAIMQRIAKELGKA